MEHELRCATNDEQGVRTARIDPELEFTQAAPLGVSHKSLFFKEGVLSFPPASGKLGLAVAP